jgi:hypothetical protein
MIGGDEVGFAVHHCIPARDGGIARAEVVLCVPALIIVLSETVEAIESDQITELVAVGNEVLEALLVIFRPLPGVRFAALLDMSPVDVDPAMIVIGISSTGLTHIFERFYRADPSRCAQWNGAWIGDCEVDSGCT